MATDFPAHLTALESPLDFNIIGTGRQQNAVLCATLFRRAARAQLEHRAAEVAAGRADPIAGIVAVPLADSGGAV